MFTRLNILYKTDGIYTAILIESTTHIQIMTNNRYFIMFFVRFYFRYMEHVAHSIGEIQFSTVLSYYIIIIIIAIII